MSISKIKPAILAVIVSVGTGGKFLKEIVELSDMSIYSAFGDRFGGSMVRFKR